MKQVKHLMITIKNLKKYKFCVKREVNSYGVKTFLPMVKRPGLFNRWEQIVVIYNKAYVMELPDVTNLSLQECYDHIQLLKDQLKEEALLSKKPDISYLIYSYESFNAKDLIATI